MPRCCPILKLPARCRFEGVLPRRLGGRWLASSILAVGVVVNTRQRRFCTQAVRNGLVPKGHSHKLGVEEERRWGRTSVREGVLEVL